MSVPDLITLEPDYETRALNDLYSQLRRDPNLRAWYVALTKSAQLLEEIIFDIIISTGLRFATGRDLDTWGELVGERRGSLDNEDYRRIIVGRVAARASNGDIPNVASIFEAITEAQFVVVHDSYPAGLVLTTYRFSPMADEYRARVRAVMLDAKLGAVSCLLIESIVDDSIVYDDQPGYDEGAYSELI